MHADPELFLSASNNVQFAKNEINECKKLILDVVLLNDSYYDACKTNIESCDIDKLVTKIDATKQTLFNRDQEFASVYMTMVEEALKLRKSLKQNYLKMVAFVKGKILLIFQKKLILF